MEIETEKSECGVFDSRPLAHSSQFFATPAAEPSAGSSGKQIDLFDFFHGKFYRKLPGRVVSMSKNSEIFASADGGDVHIFVAAKCEKLKTRSRK